MHLSALLLIGMVAGAAVAAHAHTSSPITPAALFWQQALPGTTMPDAIADLVQKGTDHSPLVEHYSVQPSISTCILFNSACDPRPVAATGVFFHEAQLRPGTTMTLSFFPAEAAAGSSAAPILPHDVAEKVPFRNLPDVLSAFNIPAGSAEADQVRDTLRRCEEPPVAGEVKSCTTSLESTVRSAVGMLGTNQGVFAATSSVLRRPAGGRYVVQEAAKLAGGRYVSCHKVPFPYAVYQCHMAAAVGRMSYGAYVVSLATAGPRGGDLLAASMLAFCHFDTSSWNPAHPAFEILSTRPGGSPVCHFMPPGDLAFVKKADTMA